jgi:EthD domain
MIKLVYCIKRKASVSPEEFYRYWLEDHGPKVKAVAAAIGATHYVQSHTILPEVNAGFRASRGLSAGYDGITEIWFDNEASMTRGLGTEGGVAAAQMLLDDESHFIDFATSSIFMTQEHEIF